MFLVICFCSSFTSEIPDFAAIDLVPRNSVVKTYEFDGIYDQSRFICSSNSVVGYTGKFEESYDEQYTGSHTCDINGSILTCQEGFELHNKFRFSCEHIEAASCVFADDSYPCDDVMTLHLGECVSMASLNSANQNCNMLGKITTCSDGHYLSGNRCNDCSAKFQGSLTCDQNQALTCEQGKVLQNRECVPC